MLIYPWTSFVEHLSTVCYVHLCFCGLSSQYLVVARGEATGKLIAFVVVVLVVVVEGGRDVPAPFLFSWRWLLLRPLP